MKRTIRLGLVFLCIGAFAACGDDGYQDPPTGDADLPHLDAGDAALQDRPVMPDRQVNPEGPDIQIQTPQPLAVLDGDQVQVTALVSDPDGVDSSTVVAVVPGGDTFNLSRTGQVQDQFSGIVDLRGQPSGSMSLVVQATDIQGNTNSGEVIVERDTGPVVSFISPDDGERYAGSVNLAFEVRDPNGVQESSVVAKVGQVILPIVKQQEDEDHGDHPQWILFTGEIVFNDVMFDPPLNGQQQVTVTAENIVNSVSSTGSITFVVDRDGPVITVTTPTAGQIVGGIVTIQADVADDAGVLETSVVAVFGHNSVQYEVPLTSSGGGPYVGSFDTSAFPHSWVFPSLSVRAADLLNNESETGFLVALDNTSPIASLDPPPTMFLSREDSDGFIECSTPFDPVGAGVPDDGTRVPQIFFLRARIEDRGNSAVGLVQMPLSLVDQTSTKLYVLDDTTQPLVVDTDGDGYCDDINPALAPSTNPQTASEVLALNLEAIPPAGDADYRQPGPGGYYETYYGTLPALPVGCAKWGTEDDAPDALCSAVEGDGGTPVFFSRALFYTVDPSEPAIYTLPLLDPASALYCTGHQFDALANNISEGWACAAVRADDNVGNRGVSKPLAFFIDYTLDGVPTFTPSTKPACTGTWNSQTQTADTTPCLFDTATQEFRANEVRREE